jgi:hypothetical protein
MDCSREKHLALIISFTILFKTIQMRRFAALFHSILLTFTAGSLYGQLKAPAIYNTLGAEGHYGFIIAHSTKIAGISHTRPIGFTATAGSINTSLESWKVFNTFWYRGFEAGYFNYRYPDVLGGVFSFVVFAEPVINHGKNHLFTIRGGVGPTYHTIYYDSIANPLNLYFSTKISFRLFLSARFTYRLSETLAVGISGNYSHISNGGVKQPNLGMNFPTASLGLHYLPRGFPVLTREYRNDLVVRPGIAWTIQALSSYRVIGKTENYPEAGLFSIGVRASASKQLSRYYALNAGAEIISDYAIKEIIRRSDLDMDFRRAAVTLGQDFLFGQTIFTQYFGIYVYSPYKARNRTYQKYELSYRINEKLYAGVFLKAHAHVAELMGVQIGYIFGRKKDKVLATIQ